ncbi:pyoverdine/dityrosine biosynthesis protein [Stachybotrys elegans]|uniref:Pyoverdine/dityrosine biosynthesis protein n=1 Tax=Stachybotrys elegans TaxID=80388 RepID=A0A8K0SJ76_9HYPO|nr:pyoverdine/dityrosine biosynthesis protein [Stachybotrys elegans]
MAYSKRLDIDAILTVFRQFGRSEEDRPVNESVGYEDIVASKVRYFHESSEAIQMLLPAAPFKNPCQEKVLDTKSPDFAEELGLSRLNHLCQELEKVYLHGAEVTVVSDGPVYNDLLCVPGSTFYDYGVKLRRLAAELGLTKIRFKRLADVLGVADGDALSKEEYLASAQGFREEMEVRHVPKDLEINDKISNDVDTNLTYHSYVKLVDEDLRWGPDLDPAIRDDPLRYATECTKVAKRMTERLLAYEGSLQAAFPNFIRLSIHRSTGNTKISLPLIPQTDSFGLQPWHCCVVVTADGLYVTGFTRDYQDRSRYNIVTKNGQPWLIREKHADFEWAEDVAIQHTYGGKVTVRNFSGRQMEMTPELQVKLANLVLSFGKVELQGPWSKG